MNDYTRGIQSHEIPNRFPAAGTHKWKHGTSQGETPPTPAVTVRNSLFILGFFLSCVASFRSTGSLKTISQKDPENPQPILIPTILIYIPHTLGSARRTEYRLHHHTRKCVGVRKMIDPNQRLCTSALPFIVDASFLIDQDQNEGY